MAHRHQILAGNERRGRTGAWRIDIQAHTTPEHAMPVVAVMTSPATRTGVHTAALNRSVTMTR